MKKLKLLSSIFILSFMIVIFTVMIFSFSTTLLKKENISSYNSNMITSFDNSITEESGWSLDQLSVSTDEIDYQELSNSSIILTDPEGNDYAYVWGSNNHGQLGIGETTDYWTDKPIQIKFDIEYTDIKFLSTKDSFSMAVLTDEYSNDLLYTWGDNSKGQLGLGASIEMTNVPILVTELPEYDEIKFIDTGAEATAIVLTKNGSDTLWTTGSNYKKALGLGDDYNDKNAVYEYTQVTFPKTFDEIISINFGSSSSIVVTDPRGVNILYTWGDNTWNQVNWAYESYYNSPTKYDIGPVGDYAIKDVVSSRLTTIVILINDNGEEVLYSWGNSSYGQAGTGDILLKISYPLIVEFPDDADIAEIKDISMGATATSAVTIDSNGKEHLYLWGDNSNYLMGNSTTETNLTVPTEIKFSANDDYTIKEINIGLTYRGMIIDYKGSNQLYMWGTAYAGGLGVGDSSGNKIIEEIKKWDQTPMITFESDPFVVNNSATAEKVLSFTLDWDKSFVSPTKIELIDSKGMVIDEASFNKIKPGMEIKINIEDIALDGIDNVRLKVSDNNKTLVISQSFNIPESFFNKFDEPINVDYNWMTAQKQLSFTLFYYPDNPIESITVYEYDNDNINKPIDINIDYETIINGEKYNIDISYLNNPSEITAYISVNLKSGITIKSEDFIIPATKLKGWITILSSSILLIILIILVIIIMIILKRKIEKNKLNKMSKLKAKNK